jgi:glycine/D-amino acid oxidase-like deaminating enzyme
LIDREDLLRLIPNATPGEIGAANFADQEGTIDPIVAANALVSAAKSLGATVIYLCEVKDFHLAEGRVRAVITTRGSMEADYIVLATGNGATELAAKSRHACPFERIEGDTGPHRSAAGTP